MAKKTFKKLTGGKRKRPKTRDELRFLESLGTAIGQARTGAKITGQVVADSISISLPVEYHREAGRASFPVEDLFRYAVAIGCLPSDLILAAEQEMGLKFPPRKTN